MTFVNLMAPKRNPGESGKVKKVRRPLSVAQRLDIIKRLEKGERSKDICASMNLSSSTVRTVYLQKDKLREMAQSNVGSLKLERVTRSREVILERTERLLTLWIDNHTCKHSSLPFSVIQEKALSLFQDLKKKAEEEGQEAPDIDFKASHGWFERYRRRADLSNIKVTFKKVNPVLDTAKPFPAELQQIIDEGGYSPKQIFNIDETGLFWKKMPSRTFLSHDEERTLGFKVSKEYLSLLLGANLEGDLKLKPLVVYHAQNPQALKGIVKTKLPVLWYWNKKALVTCEIFIHYITEYVSPLIAEYCAKNNLDNKVILVLDNAAAHPRNIEDIAPNISVVFLPPNTTSVIQPMEQGIIPVFKAYYMHQVMQYIVMGLDSDENATIQQLWKNYNIKMAIDNIDVAWGTVSKESLNSAWKYLMPKIVYDFTSFQEVLAEIQGMIVQLANEAGFDQVDNNDIQELLASHSEEPTNEELIQLLKERPKELDEAEDDIAEVKALDISTLSHLFSLAKEMWKTVEDNDPDMTRSSAFKRGLDNILSCYHELYRMKKAVARQSSCCNFPS